MPLLSVDTGGVKLIEVSNIYKYYNDSPAVSGISLNIKENGIYGFLGPNGAGKSTTMNIITGCLSASSGSVKIDGYDIFDQPEKAKSKIGYLPENPPLYMDMTPREYLSFVARAKGETGKAIEADVNKAMELTGISPVRDRLIKFLSKGYKQRVGIAQTLLGSPSIIILDEPTVGLDPKQITEIRELVKVLGTEHIVLFSSHILSEVQAISDHVIIIAQGKVIADSREQDIDKLLKKDPVISLTVKGDRNSCEEMLADVVEYTGIKFNDESENKCSFEITSANTDETAEKIFFACADRRMAILNMSIEKTTLEEAFLELTRNKDTYAVVGKKNTDDTDTSDREETTC